MITLRPYPEYKPSGVERLGNLPDFWTTRKLKRVVVRRDERVDGVTARTVYVGLENIESWTGKQRGTLHEGAASQVTIFESGDLLFGKLRPYLAKVMLPRFSGVCSPELLVLTPTCIDPRFAFWLLIDSSFIDVVNSSTFGAQMPRADWNFIGEQDVPVPSLDEQRAIADFLDVADARISRYIAAKRRLLALLEEQKQAIISQAVTRGLDPEVPLKPSGVDWLGDIPEHWNVKRLRSATRIERGRFNFRPRNDPSLYGGDTPFIQTGDIARADVVIQEYSQTLNQKGLSVSRLFRYGTLVMAIAANIGDVAFLGFDSCLPDSVVGFFPSSQLNREYLYFVLHSLKPELVSSAPINTQGNLSISRMGAISFALPSLPEQQCIVDHLKQFADEERRIRKRMDRELLLIQEYRTRLISDVVTGKLDVRGVELPALEDVMGAAIESAWDGVDG